MDEKLLDEATKKGIAIEVNLKHIDLNNQEEIDLVTHIVESLNSDLKKLKEAIMSNNP